MKLKSSKKDGKSAVLKCHINSKNTLFITFKETLGFGYVTLELLYNIRPKVTFCYEAHEITVMMFKKLLC